MLHIKYCKIWALPNFRTCITRNIIYYMYFFFWRRFYIICCKLAAIFYLSLTEIYIYIFIGWLCCCVCLRDGRVVRGMCWRDGHVVCGMCLLMLFCLGSPEGFLLSVSLISICKFFSLYALSIGYLSLFCLKKKNLSSEWIVEQCAVWQNWLKTFL